MTVQNPQQLTRSPLISAIIVNYRCWDKLRACLGSLLNTSLIDAKLEIVVVDNCSNDGRIGAFVEQYPAVSFILNKGNFGFSNGCNTGANEANGDYLFFINPDTEVPKDAIEQLHSAIQALPRYSIVATQKISTSGKYERVERFFPRWYTITGLGKSFHRLLNRRRIADDFAKDKTTVYPEWVSGSVIFIRHSDFDELNGWDERFWMYCEDIDLCNRASIKGGKIALLQNIEITHNHGGSSRINPVTAALTKSEVYISRHVYFTEYTQGIGRCAIQFLFAIKSLLKVTLIAFLSLFAFKHPKAKMARLLFFNLIRYYLGVTLNQTWLSPRSRRHKHAPQVKKEPNCEQVISTDNKF